jgi:hypothetical protein
MASQSRLAFRPGSGAEPDGVGDPDSVREPIGEGYDKRNLSTPTFLEFFAGAGLVRHGLLPTWRCVWANDIDPSKERIYTANFGRQSASVD